MALIAAYNEERFLGRCLEHLLAQGADAHVIDNGSTDATAAIARGFGERVTTEAVPRDGTFRWEHLLQRKEQLAAEIRADWFLNVDADEIHLPPGGRGTLARALAAADGAGWTAAETLEFTFVPTAEAPEHDHRWYQQTMRWYYFFSPREQHLVRAWRKPVGGDARFAWSGGHQLRHPELRIAPEPFLVKHYLCVGRAHFAAKYLRRSYDAGELARGWHGWRARSHPELLAFPPESALRVFAGDDALDTSQPRTRHWFDRPAPRAGSARGGSRRVIDRRCWSFSS